VTHCGTLFSFPYGKVKRCEAGWYHCEACQLLDAQTLIQQQSQEIGQLKTVISNVFKNGCYNSNKFTLRIGVNGELYKSLQAATQPKEQT